MKFPVLLAFLFATVGAFAQAPQAPEVAARQYLLIDLSSQQVLAERAADTQADPASLTKLMTAYLVFGALQDKRLSLEQTLPVSQRAWEQRKGDPSLMFIDPTMSPKVDELLHGMIVQSGNDASVALAEGVAGSVENFVQLMNKQAQAWGLKNTQFRNVTGMTESGHHSSARDLATIAGRLIQDFPQYYGYYKVREYTYNKIRQHNRNLLLTRDASFDGLKTGYTDAAGYCLIASSQREFPNGKRRLLSVVLGTDSREARANESQKLHNWGYAAWDGLRLYAKDKPVATVPVWKGKASQVPLGVAQDVFITLPRGEGAKLQSELLRPDPLLAPLQAGQAVGSIRIKSAGGSLLKEVPLVAQQEVAQANAFVRLWDAIRLWIQ
ncbi:MAG: D-alanyl-D-alanine carboxypeptidase [Burkholderiales bacterium]|uniref:D-alanyl-D-alanine carboxypeptidase family protein n=1 Tax=Inhella sp. TaxID=1921806 RepID=UPI001ACA3F80|nr:D-alanyl-D-alanine carboxypeptidase [Burkholderiales bacterium]